MAYIGRTPTNAALTASDLADGIVSTAKIAADAVTDAKIADDVVGTEHLTANEVDTTALGADAVTGAQLADDAVNSEHYTDGSIDTAHIAADQITNAKIADDQIDSEHYVDGSIDTAHIADVNVTQGKIADQAINEAKMQISNAPTNGYFLSAQSGNTGGLTWAEAGGGITGADFWRLNGDVQFGTSTQILDSNWERVDSDSYGVIGSAMTESSGHFTFPSTGIWLIQHQVSIFRSNGEIQRHDSRIAMTTNNSSYDDAAFSHMSTDAANYRQSTCFSFIFDCENTSTHKIRFNYYDVDNNNPTLVGATNATCTGAMFVRLGDT